ncbi:uncharacterized protein LOC116852963 [Odontomachus brunneus]|uniref:uncharacterized protein LOC116852963 n=1 Tax=Odontomachus brunneus TaxID=486640 RepID=UPI0013F28670|nr:uncharacterized protein LOC116852963 [Odontomachus brunneus]
MDGGKDVTGVLVNVNRSWLSFDLMIQYMNDGVFSIGIVSKLPRRCLDLADWFASSSGLAAIIFRHPVIPLGCALVRRGCDIVAVRVGDLVVVSCYVSPNATRSRYLEFLDKLGDIVSEAGGRRVLIGDNAQRYRSEATSLHPRWNYARMNMRALIMVLEWDGAAGPVLGVGNTCDGSVLRRMTWRLDELRGEYCVARDNLRGAISKAKAAAWTELVRTVEADPWGRPYRLVLNRLRHSYPRVSESLPADLLRALIGSLFPAGDGRAIDPCTEVTWTEEDAVQIAETYAAIRHKRSQSIKVPGLDGIRSIVWRNAPRELVERLTS